MTDMILISVLIVWALFGFAAQAMAKARGRNEVVGFISGVLFGFLALIYYTVVGDTIEMQFKKIEALKK